MTYTTRSWFRSGHPAVLATIAVLTACLAGPPTPPGSEAAAVDGVRDFLGNLANGRDELAWAALTPETREALYGGDDAVFAEDVAAADWPAVHWEIGVYVASRDISWAVYVEVGGGSVNGPEFLIRRGIAAPWRVADENNVVTDRGFILLVQPTGASPLGYLIPGMGLDQQIQ